MSESKPWLRASGTSLIVIRARVATEVNGVAIPLSAQRASRWGRILSRGNKVTRVDETATLVYFNPAMVAPGLEDQRGKVAFDVIDEEAVLVEANDAYAEVAGLSFDMPDLTSMTEALAVR